MQATQPSRYADINLHPQQSYQSDNNIIIEDSNDRIAALEKEIVQLKKQIVYQRGIQIDQSNKLNEKIKDPFFMDGEKEIQRQLNTMCARILKIPSTPQSEKIRKRNDATVFLAVPFVPLGLGIGTKGFLMAAAGMAANTVGIGTLFLGGMGLIMTGIVTVVAPIALSVKSQTEDYPLDHRNPSREREFRAFTAKCIDGYLEEHPNKYKKALNFSIEKYLESNIKDKVPEKCLKLAGPKPFRLLEKD
jgi:hypothetical protein